MKKLMIASLGLAVAGSVWAGTGNCGPKDDAEPENCAAVYAFKANVKTTKGLVRGAGKGSLCGKGDGCDVIRVKDTTKWVGWIYDCCRCDVVKDGDVVLWDSKRKGQIEDATITTLFLNVIGKKQSDAEWAFTLGGDVNNLDNEDDKLNQKINSATFAGFGKYSEKKGYYTSFSGNFAGYMAPSFDLAAAKKAESTENCACDPSKVWDCQDLDELVDGDDTVAYGTWTVKYNASASRAYEKKGVNGLKVPDYVGFEDAGSVPVGE